MDHPNSKSIPSFFVPEKIKINNRIMSFEDMKTPQDVKSYLEIAQMTDRYDPNLIC